MERSGNYPAISTLRQYNVNMYTLQEASCFMKPSKFTFKLCGFGGSDLSIKAIHFMPKPLSVYIKQ